MGDRDVWVAALVEAWQREDFAEVERMGQALGLVLTPQTMRRVQVLWAHAHRWTHQRRLSLRDVIGVMVEARYAPEGHATLDAGAPSDDERSTTVAVAHRQGHRLTLGISVSLHRDAWQARAWYQERGRGDLAAWRAWAEVSAPDRMTIRCL